MKSVVTGAIVLLIVVAAIVVVYNKMSPDLPVNRNPKSFNLIKQLENEGIPKFSLPTLEGANFDTAQIEPKVTILNFWASWCNPCVAEYPSLLKLVQHFKGDLSFVAISEDDDRKDIDNFLKAFGYDKSVVHILRDSNKQVMDQFGVEKIPESFIFGKNHKLIRKVVGVENWYTDSSISYFQNLMK